MREALARIAALSIVLSAAAVAGVKLSVTGLVRIVLEAFASPGEFLWWATLGGAFSGYPTGPTGVIVWILGTALFWFVVFTAAYGLFSRLARRGPARRA